MRQVYVLCWMMGCVLCVASCQTSAPRDEKREAKRTLARQAPRPEITSGTSERSAIEKTSPQGLLEPTAPGEEESATEGDALLAQIEDSSGEALSSFFEGLQRLEDGTAEEGEKVRVVYYGDSHVAADIFTGTVRRKLQERFGDGGPGFLYPGKVWKSYRCLDVHNGTSRRAHWKTVRGGMGRSSKLDGIFGLGGVTTSSKKSKASVWLEMKGKRGNAGLFEVMYATDKKGGEFDVILDEKRVARVQTRSKQEPSVGVWSQRGSARRFEVRARTKRSVRLLGMVMERAESGVVLDMLGINGARTSTSRVWDKAVWKRSVRWRAPRLMVLAYGTNEIAAKTKAKTHGKHLRRMLTTLQSAAPKASCLIVGPPDYAVKVERDGEEMWEPIEERVDAIVEEQRTVAREFGCAFWSTRRAMGGTGSIAQWAVLEPPWALYDRIHLTWPGYESVAEDLVQALMVAYEARRGAVQVQ